LQEIDNVICLVPIPTLPRAVRSSTSGYTWYIPGRPGRSSWK